MALIAESDANVRSVFETALRPYCSELWQVASGVDALAVLAERDVNLLLLELRLPDIDGLAILEKLARDRPAIRVFVLAGNATDAWIDEARGHGIAGIITKPVTVDDIRRTLRPDLILPPNPVES